MASIVRAALRASGAAASSSPASMSAPSSIRHLASARAASSSSASASARASSAGAASSSSSSSSSSSASGADAAAGLAQPPPLIDAGAAIRVRRGEQRASSLDANPYVWPDASRIAKQAPLWMLYEAEREETLVKRTGKEERKEAGDTARGAQIDVPALDEQGRAYATGRRKTSTARVWVKLGDGAFEVNGRPLAEYFPQLVHRQVRSVRGEGEGGEGMRRGPPPSHLPLHRWPARTHIPISHTNLSLDSSQASIDPFVATQSCGAFDVSVVVEGGGESGQAGAVKHGLAKALCRFDPQLKPILRQCAWADGKTGEEYECSGDGRGGRRVLPPPPSSHPSLVLLPLSPLLAVGMIHRDPRMVERKKPGQKKARKQFQWVRR
jgi:small subunit ribosomal protein S9